MEYGDHFNNLFYIFYVTSGTISIDFSPYGSYFYGFFVCLVFFDGMLDTINITFLVVRIFPPQSLLWDAVTLLRIILILLSPDFKHI